MARRSIEEDTVLLPHIIADGVVQEVVRYLYLRDRCSLAGLGDIEALSTSLAQRAERIYLHNSRFAQRLRRASGRDWLYAFMRHWLTAEVGKRGIKLPDSFAVGHPL